MSFNVLIGQQKWKYEEHKFYNFPNFAEFLTALVAILFH